MEKENKTFYELNLSQEVVKLQCTYTLFKKVVNIITSVEVDDYIDFDVMEEAFNKAVERNDCTRIRLVKKGRKLLQYFEGKVVYDNIPRLEFKTKEEQDAFIHSQTKRAIKYLKGEMLKPTFIKTYDGKSMIFFKVCHYIFDIYGLNFFINDLFSVYEALVKGEELPKEPKKFEDLLKKDLETKYDPESKKSHYEYFNKLFSSNPEPYYAGFDGMTNKYVKKARAKNQRPVKMFFIKNDTKTYGHKIEKEQVEKLVQFSKENNTTIASLLLYLYSVTQSRMNDDAEFLLPLELCNLRDTLLAKKCAGTKVQSLNVLTKVDKNLSFKENLEFFVKEQSENYRHIGMSDMEHQVLLHKVYKTSMMTTYYSLAYSFIPFESREGVKINFYSNGKCALPCYAALLYDYKNSEIMVGYDCQIKLMSEQNVKVFHQNLVKCIDQALGNPQMLIKDIKVDIQA